MTLLLRSKFIQLGIYCATKTKPNWPVIRHTNIPQLSVWPQLTCRWLSLTSPMHQEAQEDAEDSESKPEEKPKRPIVDLETSKRYLESNAYKLTYGGAPVWVPYRRNHKGRRPSVKTRKMCIRAGVVATGNPCPICRDEFLKVHYTHVELLKQFISPTTGELLSTDKTGVCQTEQKKMQVALRKAWDTGYIKMPLPVRLYNYEEYYPQLQKQKHKKQE